MTYRSKMSHTSSALDPMLETALSGAEQRFKWLRFWRYLGLVGLAVVVTVLLLGVLMERGWLESLNLTVGILLALFAVAVLALPAIGVVALATQRSREWSAREVEEVNPSLLDRLHTLVFLKQRDEADPVLDTYGRRIERQAVREMLLGVKPFEDESRRTRRLWLGCLLLGVLTMAFYSRFHPLANLNTGSVFENYVPAGTEEPLLEAPIADAAELQEEREAPAWGEVRITEPGRDLKVTKVDVVPMQIEAATSRPMRTADWITTLTGAEPREHDLPPPEEPRFAVYKPVLYVDELRLSDWDVVTYYAKAATAADEYASDVYFLEVRPFREEIEKLAGQGGGQGMDLMNQCTGLIDQQKHILRQTHRYLARPALEDEVRRQDQDKLVTAEDELTEAVRHLYAQMAAEMENQAIGDVLDHLAAAEDELERATSALADDVATAPPPEQSALAQLVATRKSLQKSISENPDAFGGSESEDEPFPIAELPDKLKQISEFRDEEKAALELLDEVLDEQREIEEKISGNPDQLDGLATEHEASRRKLDQFADEHPRLAEGAREEAERAGEALRSAGEALESMDGGAAGERQAEAVSAVEELREAVEQQTLLRQLGDAYKLKQLVEEQAREMGEIEERPGDFSGSETSRTTEAAKETTRELKEMMEDSPVGQGFGPELRQALSDRNQGKLERDLDAAAEAGDQGSRSQAAGAARQGLEAVSEAFEKSAPRLVQELKEQDALGSGDGEALDDAMRQLEALLGGVGGRPAAADEAQRREALSNLRQGLEGLYGDRREAVRLYEEIEEEVERDAEIDVAKLRRLLDKLERFRTEMGGVEVEKLELDLAHIDPSELPAEYRERIQNYFRKLSENPP